MSVVIIVVMSWPWPFRDDRAFWVWAMDEHAELDSQDEDLLLDDPAGWGLLIAAADLSLCPKQGYCAIVLEDIAMHVAWRADRAELAALAAAAADARQGLYDLVRAWAAYVDRLLGYLKPSGQVNRARAERMTADLFTGPFQQQRLGNSDWLEVQIAAKGRLWEGISRFDRCRVYINRRTGVWRKQLPPLTGTELAALCAELSRADDQA